MSSAEVVFVVATSSSFDSYYTPRIIEFLMNMTMSLPIDSGQVRVGLVTYGAQPQLDIELGSITTASGIVDALDSITYHGGRSFYSAIYIILTQIPCTICIAPDTVFAAIKVEPVAVFLKPLILSQQRIQDKVPNSRCPTKAML